MFTGPIVGSRTEPLDVGLLVFIIESKIKVVEHKSSDEQCYDYYIKYIEFSVTNPICLTRY
jgi:hypothetical protein